MKEVATYSSHRATALRHAISIAACLALCGCADIAAPQVGLPSPYTQNGVTIVVDGLWRNGAGDVSGISGIATNVTHRDLTVCIINLDVLDASGVKVSSAIASTTGLKAGQQWRFQATFTTPYAVSFSSIGPGSITAM